MKKTRIITTLALTIVMLAATAIPAYATPHDNIINRAIANNEALLISVGIEDRNPDGRLRYGGNDFSDEAIRARINALRTVFPQNMAFGPRQGVNCTHFTSTARVLVFGNLFTVNTRRHTDWNQLRVGDTVAVRNRAGNSHSVLVIDISDNGVITIAEGNFGAQVNWDRTFTMADLSATRGWNSGIAITSHFDANGNIMLSRDENGRTILRNAEGEITGFFQSDGNGGYIALNVDGTPLNGGGTAPAVTTTAPTAPVQTTPAQTPTVTTPTTPAQRESVAPAQVAPHNSFVVTNDGTNMRIDTTGANGSTGFSNMRLSNGARGTTNGLAWSISGTTITLTIDDRTYTVAPGESVTINR